MEGASGERGRGVHCMAGHHHDNVPWLRCGAHKAADSERERAAP